MLLRAGRARHSRSHTAFPHFLQSLGGCTAASDMSNQDIPHGPEMLLLEISLTGKKTKGPDKGLTWLMDSRTGMESAVTG